MSILYEGNNRYVHEIILGDMVMNYYNETTASDRLWSKKQLATFLGMSIYWIDRQVMHNAQDPIPHLKIGKLVRFDPGDADFRGWLGKHKVLSSQEH